MTKHCVELFFECSIHSNLINSQVDQQNWTLENKNKYMTPYIQRSVEVLNNPQSHSMQVKQALLIINKFSQFKDLKLEVMKNVMSSHLYAVYAALLDRSNNSTNDIANLNFKNENQTLQWLSNLFMIYSPHETDHFKKQQQHIINRFYILLMEIKYTGDVRNFRDIKTAIFNSSVESEIKRWGDSNEKCLSFVNVF